MELTLRILGCSCSTVNRELQNRKWDRVLLVDVDSVVSTSQAVLVQDSHIPTRIQLPLKVGSRVLGGRL